MRRAAFGLAAAWEIARFAILFTWIVASLDQAGQEIASVLVWLCASQLSLAAGLGFGVARPGRVRDVSLNMLRIGKVLTVVAGAAAILDRMYRAIAAGQVLGPLEWIRSEPVVLLVVAVDLTLVLFLLSYQPSAPPPMALPDYDVTDLEEE